MRKELAWLRRGPPARTSKPQFRIEAANALIADVPDPRDQVALRRLATARLGRKVVECRDVTLRVPDRPAASERCWPTSPGGSGRVIGSGCSARTASGKTTLVRAMLGERAPDAGQITIGTTVVPAMLAQHIALEDPEDRVLPSVQRIRREVQVGRRTLTASTCSRTSASAGSA